MNLRIIALASACVLAASCGGSGAVDVGPAPGQNAAAGPAKVACGETVAEPRPVNRISIVEPAPG